MVVNSFFKCVYDSIAFLPNFEVPNLEITKIDVQIKTTEIWVKNRRIISHIFVSIENNLYKHWLNLLDRYHG